MRYLHVAQDVESVVRSCMVGPFHIHTCLTPVETQRLCALGCLVCLFVLRWLFTSQQQSILTGFINATLR